MTFTYIALTIPLIKMNKTIFVELSKGKIIGVEIENKFEVYSHVDLSPRKLQSLSEIFIDSEIVCHITE